MNRNKSRGVWVKWHVFFLPLAEKQGRGRRNAGGARPVALGHGGGREVGEKGQVGAGDQFPSLISEEGTRREGCDGPGHGGRAAEKGLGVAVELVGVVSCAGSLFTGEAGRWRWGAVVMVAGELDGAPLMAFQPLAAIVEWRTGGEVGTG